MRRFFLISLPLFLTIHPISAQYTESKHIVIEKEGALIRSDTTRKTIYLCFTAHEFGEGFPLILKTLDSFQAKASFFFTGDFIRNNPELVLEIYHKGHYVGPHSDKHLLYCDWNNRDNQLLSADSIIKDLKANIRALAKIGIPARKCRTFMPPYEWYNSSIHTLFALMGINMVNFTPGTSSNADYTIPGDNNYLSSDSIFNRIIRYEKTHKNGLNGFHLLIHGGTDSRRPDKLYQRLGEMMKKLPDYKFERF